MDKYMRAYWYAFSIRKDLSAQRFSVRVNEGGSHVYGLRQTEEHHTKCCEFELI